MTENDKGTVKVPLLCVLHAQLQNQPRRVVRFHFGRGVDKAAVKHANRTVGDFQ